MLDIKNDAAPIIETVKDLHKPQVVMVKDPITGREVPLVFGPKGFDCYEAKIDLDAWLDAPRRLKGQATTETLQGFIDLVVRHKVPDTAIFARSGDAPTLLAVIDYHKRNGESGAGSSPTFCEHKVLYAFPKTPELLAWQKAGGWQGQQAFAQFLDTRRFDLIDPLDVEVKEGTMVHDIMMKATARDKRETVRPEQVYAGPAEIMQLVESLYSTQRTKWAETKTDRYGGIKVSIEKEGKIDGDEKIPSLFLVEIAPFVGSSKLVLPARLRATVSDGRLHLAAELMGIERVLERGFLDALETVARDTQVQVVRGTPEA